MGLLVTLLLLFYVLPFAVVVSIPNWKALFVIGGVAGAFIGYGWILQAQPGFNHGFFGNIGRIFTTVAVASGFAARSFLLASGRQALSVPGLGIIGGFFVLSVVSMYVLD